MIKEGQHEGSRGAAPPDRTLPALHVSHSGTQPRSYLLGWNPERPRPTQTPPRAGALRLDCGPAGAKQLLFSLAALLASAGRGKRLGDCGWSRDGCPCALAGGSPVG